MHVILSAADETFSTDNLPASRPEAGARAGAAARGAHARAARSPRRATCVTAPGTPRRAPRGRRRGRARRRPACSRCGPTRETVFKGDASADKRAAWTHVFPLERVRAVAEASGTKINDVLMAAATGGLRRYLEEAGEPVAGVEVRAAVPVNVRPLERASELGNSFGLAFLLLPVSLDGPAARLAEVKRRMDALKGSAAARPRLPHPAVDRARAAVAPHAGRGHVQPEGVDRDDERPGPDARDPHGRRGRALAHVLGAAGRRHRARAEHPELQRRGPRRHLRRRGVRRGPARARRRLRVRVRGPRRTPSRGVRSTRRRRRRVDAHDALAAADGPVEHDGDVRPSASVTTTRARATPRRASPPPRRARRPGSDAPTPRLRRLHRPRLARNDRQHRPERPPRVRAAEPVPPTYRRPSATAQRPLHRPLVGEPAGSRSAPGTIPTTAHDSPASSVCHT